MVAPALSSEAIDIKGSMMQGYLDFFMHLQEMSHSFQASHSSDERFGHRSKFLKIG